MCCEDLKIGRKTEVKQRSLNMPATCQEIVPKDSRRIALIIGSPSGVAWLFGTENNLSATVGVRVAADSEPVKLLLSEHGDIVRGPIYGISGGAATPFTFIETLDVTNVCENQ